MKAIKALVVFMGILLVVGLGLVGYGVATKTGPSKTEPATKPHAVAAGAGEEFGSVTVPLPAGARLEQALVVGEKVVLRVTGAGPERLIVLDPANGRITGSFVLSPETKPTSEKLGGR